MNILGITDALPFGVNNASVLGFSRYGVAAASPPVGSFDIVGYGADATGVSDSTAAIQAAIAAASEVGTSSNVADIWIPEGTFKCQPPATALGTIYEKVSGTWTKIGGDDRSVDAQIVGTSSDFWYQDSAPASEGANGDVWFNYRTGLVYTKSAGIWTQDGKLMDGSGTGWQSSYSSTSAYPTHYATPSGGSDGDWAIMYRMDFDNYNDACWELGSDNNYIRFIGAGPTSILKFWCWGNEDPMDYAVAGGVITANRIPMQMDTRAVATSQGQGVPKRGGFFALNGVTVANFDQIYWDNFKFDGSTIANGYHNFYSPEDVANEWDESHKCIAFTFGGTRGITYTKVSNVIATGFRGEVYYKGGIDTDAVIDIIDCTISECNASAISISGECNATRVTITNCYNAAENFCVGAQSSTFTDCNIDSDAGTWRGENGIVYLGSNTASLTVTGCNIGGMKNAAIFLADAAENVTITGNVLRDTPWGVYAYYQNQYGFLPAAFNNITISENIFKASARTVEKCVYALNSGNIAAANWVLDANVLATENGFFIFGFLSDFIDNLADNHDVTISNMDALGTSTFIGARDATTPVVTNCTYNPSSQSSYTAGAKTFFVNVPHVRITHLGEDNQVWTPVFTASNLFNGHTIQIDYAAGSDVTRDVVFPAASWNTWASDIVMSNNSSTVWVWSSATAKFSIAP